VIKRKLAHFIGTEICCGKVALEVMCAESVTLIQMSFVQLQNG